MCGVCGCGDDNKGPVLTKILDQGQEQEILLHDHPHDHKHPHNHAHEHGHAHSHGHTHTHDHTHEHTHEHEHKTVIELEKDILQKNQIQAERNRGYFSAKKMFALNMVSSPGSGKTTILERTLTDLKDNMQAYVIEGDQQTLNDALRIKATDTPVVQVNTGQGCHLESEMIFNALNKLEPVDHSVLFIENVGNLVCPAMFDLGESARVVIISVTEGDDKPIKYPDAFHSSQYCMINKTDLLPYVNFDVKKAKEYALQINPSLKFFEVSATTGEGMDAWYTFLKSQII